MRHLSNKLLQNILTRIYLTPRVPHLPIDNHLSSMSRKGNCYDNCIMETIFGRLKNEMFYGYEKEYTSFEIFSKAIADYIDYYNNRRIQAKNKVDASRKIPGSIHDEKLIIQFK